METVSIRMFGPLEIMIGPRRLPSFATRKSQSLFSYLLLYRDRAHPRDVLAGMFWGEYPEATARKHLRDALWRIRQVLSGVSPHGLQLEVEGRAVGMEMNHESWLDIREFEKSVDGVERAGGRELTSPEAALLSHAVDLYRADLLQEVYDDWCVYHRERLRVLALEALQRLMNFHLHRNEWSAALQRGERLLNADPLHEPVHRALMRCYCGMGNRSAALKQFQTCCQLLQDELDVGPAPDTLALYEEIRRADTPHPGTHEPEASRAALVTEALKRLHQADRGLRRTRRDLRAGTDAIRRAFGD